MKHVAIIFGLLSVLLVSCNEPQPTQPSSDLVGVWTGQIDSNPMQIEIGNNSGVLEGMLTWEEGNPVHGLQISEVRAGMHDSVFISLARFGDRITVAILSGRRTGNVIKGAYTRVAGDVGLAETGSWSAEKEPRTPAVIGSWSWIKSVGGIAGWELTPPPAVRIEYSKDGVFSYYRNDTLVSTTSYTITLERARMSFLNVDVIHYGDSLRFVPQQFLIVDDTLHLFDQCVDCYSHRYVRER